MGLARIRSESWPTMLSRPSGSLISVASCERSTDDRLDGLGLRGEAAEAVACSCQGGVEVSLCPHPEKLWYSTKARAKLGLRRSSMQNRAHVHVYRCECGGWHLGHKLGFPSRASTHG
jgi:hypothetical protein